MQTEDFRRVLAALVRFVTAFGFNPDDAEEVAQEAIVQAYRRDLGEIENLGAFLFWTARNRAIDRSRRARRRAGTETLTASVEDVAAVSHYSAEDDGIAALIERDASGALVEHGLRAANAADDRLVVRVVAAWLELANETGEAPSSRDVAPRAGLSHTSVNQALSRFRDYFPGPDARSS